MGVGVEGAENGLSPGGGAANWFVGKPPAV